MKFHDNNISLSGRFHRQALLLVLCAVLLLPACSGAPLRTSPMPEELSGKYHLFDRWEIRTWGDEPPAAFNQAIQSAQFNERFRTFADHFRKAPNFLSISGGGANGAYGAGLITGWTKSGQRPNFSIVTGVSTGALIAPFAFLGPDFDWTLNEIYNAHGTEDLVNVRALIPSIFSDALFDTNPLKQRIAAYLTMDEMKLIAAEHDKGRVLLIGTTDMDALRPVMWNIGKIAKQGDPPALELIHRIILASAAIPVAFPPVTIPIAHEGKVYEELHADGGVTNQVFLFPPGLDWMGFVEHFNIKAKPELYIIRNDHMVAEYKITRARLKPLASRSIDSPIRTQGIGDLFRLYVTAKTNSFYYYLAHVPNDFYRKTDEMFDPDYMRPLYQIGHEQGKQGGCWYSTPPGLKMRKNDPGTKGCKPVE